ncbi:hypothetical protein D3C77_426530 [compost metagenome]
MPVEDGCGFTIGVMIGQVVLQECVRRQSECLTSTLHAFLTQPPGQTLFGQVDKQRTLIALAQCVMHGSILPRFVVGHITDQVAVIRQAIGEYQGFALQPLGNAHLAQPHGAEDQPVRAV